MQVKSACPGCPIQRGASKNLSDCGAAPYLRFFLVRNEEVAGSIPVSSTKLLCFAKAGCCIRLSATQASPLALGKWPPDLRLMLDTMRLVYVVFRPLEKDSKVANWKLEKWLKEPGERVRKGEPLFTVRSEEYYLPLEIAAPDSGTLRKVIVAAGTQLSDGTLLGYIFRDN